MLLKLMKIIQKKKNKIIKKAIIELGSKNENIDDILKKAEENRKKF